MPDADAAVAARILVVTTSARRRGAEIQASQLVERLRRHGRSVELVALSSGTDQTALPIRVLGRRRLGLRTMWRLRRLARRADVVIAYGSSTLPACGLALTGLRTPFIYRSISDPRRWVRSPVHRFVTRAQYRRADAIAALWDDAATSVIELFGVPPSTITTISNARDPDDFRPPSTAERSAAREKFHLDPSDVAVAFIGNLSREKRVDVAIEAMRGLDRHVLLVAGAGPLRTEAEALADQLAPGRIHFLGQVTDVRPLLHATDVVVITSDVEGMPGVAIEAAMSGVPVLAYDAGALSTMPGVRLVDRGPEALAQALGEPFISPDPAEFAALSWPAVTVHWIELLDRVVTESAMRRRQSVRRLARRRSHTRAT